MISTILTPWFQKQLYLWYLNEELVDFAFFDENFLDKVMKEMLNTLFKEGNEDLPKNVKFTKNIFEIHIL